MPPFCISTPTLKYRVGAVHRRKYCASCLFRSVALISIELIAIANSLVPARLALLICLDWDQSRSMDCIQSYNALDTIRARWLLLLNQYDGTMQTAFATGLNRGRQIVVTRVHARWIYTLATNVGNVNRRKNNQCIKRHRKWTKSGPPPFRRGGSPSAQPLAEINRLDYPIPTWTPWPLSATHSQGCGLQCMIGARATSTPPFY